MAKKFLYLLVAMLPLFIVSACSDDDDKDANGLVGSWELREGDYFVMYTFNDGGKGNVVIYTDKQDCKASYDWSADDKFIYISNPRAEYGFSPEDFNEDGSLMMDGEGKFSYRLDGNTLWLTQDGDEMPFKRI